MRSIRSRQIHLAGILGMVALVGAGCGGGHSKGNAYLSLQWTVADVGDPSTGLNCADVGAGDVVVTMVNNATQTTYTDTFRCDSQGYAGTSAYVPNGVYSVTVRLFGDPQVYLNSTTLLDELSSTQTLVAGANTLPQTDFLVNSFVLGWSVTRGGVASTCAAVGARYVELDVYFSGQKDATAYYLDCSGYNPAATLAIPMGTYSIQWQAFLVDGGYYDIIQGGVSTPLTSYTVTTGVQANLGTAYFAL